MAGIKVELSPAQLETLQEAFTQFDKDNSGTIDVGELRLVMQSIGQNPTEKEVQEMFDAVDVDNSGEIDFDEFVELMTRRVNAEDEPEEDWEIEEAFRYFDKDGSGSVDAEEIQAIFREFSEEQDLDEIRGMIKFIDPSGDGLLRVEQFKRLVKEPAPAAGGVDLGTPGRERASSTRSGNV